MDYFQKSLELHKLHQGKIEVISKVPLTTREELSLAYTPGVAEPCRCIAANREEVYTYTTKGNMVAVITDGSAVLGLGNIGPEAGLPVMEGKCAIFKTFAGIDAIPICLRTQDTEEIISIVKALEPSLGGINLEDISAPRCFEIESRLKKELSIPVMHDDQHGTAIVVLAGITNALKITGKILNDVRIVISGAGAAGIAITNLLLKAGAKHIILCDSQGIISKKRSDLNPIKKEMLLITNQEGRNGTLQDALKGADIFIGVSAPNLLKKDDIAVMNKDCFVFALSNPTPEIMPDEARAGGAFIVATGRSDYPNQLNNALAYPGVFKGALKMHKQITDEMKVAAAKALAGLVKNPSPEKIIPSIFEPGLVDAVAEAVILSEKN